MTQYNEQYIRDNLDTTNWNHVSKMILSHEFITEFHNSLNWNLLSEFGSLKEDTIRDFKHKVNWQKISKYQDLSEDFIRDFQFKVDWFNIFLYQDLSIAFIREFHDKIPNDRLIIRIPI